MKILYITPFFPNDSDCAAATRANRLLSLLNNKVDLRIIGYGKTKKTSPFALTTITKLVHLRTSFLGYLASFFFSPYPRAFYKHDSPSARRTLLDLLAEFKPDVVHLDTLKTLCHMRSIRGPKIVMHTHDAHTKKILTRMGRHRGIVNNVDLFVQYLKIKNVEKYLSRNATVCIVDSLTDCRAVQKLNKTLDVRVVPIGYGPEQYNPIGGKAEMGSKSILFTGNMNSVQTEDAVLELVNDIMPLVRITHPDVRLYLVGANPSQKILTICHDDPNIIVTGFVEDMGAYLRGASAYVCPLRIGSGMKTRIIEALAAGSAIVSTASGLEGLTVNIGESTPWIHAETTNEIANGLVSLLSDRGKATALSEKAAAYALSQNSWEAVSNKIVNIYEEIIS